MKTRILILFTLVLGLSFACNQKKSAALEETADTVTSQPAPEYMKMITAKVYIKQGREEDFISAAKVMIENSNKEEGCLGYMLYQDPYQGTNFIFVERYKNQAAVDAHFATPYFQEFGTAIAEMTSKDMEISILDIAGEK